MKYILLILALIVSAAKASEPFRFYHMDGTVLRFDKTPLAGKATVTVMGYVSKPGVYIIDDAGCSLVDLLRVAGPLKEPGFRPNLAGVKIITTEGAGVVTNVSTYDIREQFDSLQPVARPLIVRGGQIINIGFTMGNFAVNRAGPEVNPTGQPKHGEDQRAK
jgi:membrane-associated protease RseP (regulator of RpoE activity)